ncbi:hypothetical protein CMK14_23300 [Candidatus Poribacteria bacterium]|nr:hypothetical protein [Candidatus Poribacteria bacterium]
MYYRYWIHPAHRSIYDDPPYAQIQAELTAKLDRLQAEAGDQPNSYPASRSHRGDTVGYCAGKVSKMIVPLLSVLSQFSTNLSTDKQL